MYFSTSAEEDRIMEHVFKRRSIRINKDPLHVNQPKNNRYVWQKPAKGESFQHVSYVSIESEDIIIRQQGTPGDCILCDEKLYGCYFAHMEDHYHRRHYFKALKIYDHIIIPCKCKDVPYRGLDNYKRNSHWYCPECYKPVNDRKQYAQHLRQKHNYHSNIIDVLCSKIYPHW